MDKPSISKTVDFRRSVQILNSGEDLAPDQAIGLQAKSAIQCDSRISDLDSETKHFLEGAAAALAIVHLRDSSIAHKLPLISRALSDEHGEIISDAVMSVSMTGAASVRFFVLNGGEDVAVIVIQPGQVSFMFFFAHIPGNCECQ